jgi:ribonuclease P protein component
MPPGGERGRSKRGKRSRLSRSADFDRVYREGRSHASRHLVVYAFPRAAGEEPPRLGLSVGRKVGGAVERNRIKRLLREAFERECTAIPANHDVVIKARPDVHDLAEREGLEGVSAALAELVEKAGFAG